MADLKNCPNCGQKATPAGGTRPTFRCQRCKRMYCSKCQPHSRCGCGGPLIQTGDIIVYD